MPNFDINSVSPMFSIGDKICLGLKGGSLLYEIRDNFSDKFNNYDIVTGIRIRILSEKENRYEIFYGFYRLAMDFCFMVEESLLMTYPDWLEAKKQEIQRDIRRHEEAILRDKEIIIGLDRKAIELGFNVVRETEATEIPLDI